MGARMGVAGGVCLKRTFAPSSSFLRNENRTILSRDIAKKVENPPTHGVGRGVYWVFHGSQGLTTQFLDMSGVICTLALRLG